MDKILKRFEDFYVKNKDEKSIVKLGNDNTYSIIYRRLLVQKNYTNIEIYDTSTDIYRPLKQNEIEDLNNSEIDDFCNRLFVLNSKKRIRHNRYLMQLGIGKKNDKQKLYHYKIASKEIKNLKKFLDINNI